MLRRFALVSLFAVLAACAYAQDALFSFGPNAAGEESFLKIAEVGISVSHAVGLMMQGNFVAKNIGKPKISEATAIFRSDSTPEMDEWINSMLISRPILKSFRIRFNGRDNDALCKFGQSYPVLWSTPDLDARAGNKPVGFTLGMSARDADVVQLNHHGSSTSSNSRTYTAGHFELIIDGLEAACRRVSSVDAITVKQVANLVQFNPSSTGLLGGDLNGDGFGDYTSSDLVFTLPMQDALAFSSWFNGEGSNIITPRSASLEFQDSHGDAMHVLKMSVTIQSMSLDLGQAECKIRCSTSKLIWSPKSN